MININNIQKIELTEEEENVAKIIASLFDKGYITIGVNIEPEHAKYGDGQWNVTKAYAKIGDDYFHLDEGSVEIIEGI